MKNSLIVSIGLTVLIFFLFITKQFAGMALIAIGLIGLTAYFAYYYEGGRKPEYAIVAIGIFFVFMFVSLDMHDDTLSNIMLFFWVISCLFFANAYEKPVSVSPYEKPVTVGTDKVISNHCPECGKPNTGKTKFCSDCGASLEESITPKPIVVEEKTPEKAKKLDTKIIIAVIGGILIIGVIAAVMFSMAADGSRTRSIAVTAQNDRHGLITITNNGGPDIGDVSSFTETVDGNIVYPLEPSVGSKITTAGKVGERSHVIVTAILKNHHQQVVLDTTV